jgi:hypothetical protein
LTERERDDDAVATASPSGADGRLGRLNERGAVCGMIGDRGDAERGGDGPDSGGVCGGDRAPKPLGDGARAGGVGARKKDAKLRGGGARDDVALAKLGAERCGDGAEDGVRDLVSGRGDEALEAIDLDGDG